MDVTSKCDYCKIEAKRLAGQEITCEERNEWMWGCMCEEGSAAAADSFMNLISR